MLVAMKGHPGSGKSTLARSLAKALQWPLLDKDDIRDCTRPLQLALSLSAPPPAASSAQINEAEGDHQVLLNAMAYQVLWRVAETQLQMGLSIIVDSPLSRPSLFQSAAALATTYGLRLIILECVPSDAQTWRQRLERRAAVASDNEKISAAQCDVVQSGAAMALQDGYGCAGWHKPACWEDLQALIQRYEGCNEYDVPAPARKLVVDTTSPTHSSEALHSAVLCWLLSVCDDTPLVSILP